MLCWPSPEVSGLVYLHGLSTPIDNTACEHRDARAVTSFLGVSGGTLTGCWMGSSMHLWVNLGCVYSGWHIALVTAMDIIQLFSCLNFCGHSRDTEGDCSSIRCGVLAGVSQAAAGMSRAALTAI